MLPAHKPSDNIGEGHLTGRVPCLIGKSTQKKEGVPLVVYVINRNGQPLMPTERYGKVRRMLKSGKAKVVIRCPFTIQLLYETGNVTQSITLGVDAGSKTIGLSATTEEKELYASEVMLRTDVVELMSTRREYRRARRNRKTRYRQARFDNRVHSKSKGWFAPSVEQKIHTHLKVIANIHKILPVTKIVVETASFDTQLLKAKEYGLELPEGTDYQQGEQLKFFNTREYVLFRDGHQCQCCKGKSKDRILNVHHIESRKTGGNAPNNLVTLCETCHKRFHRGEIKLPTEIKRGTSYRDAAFMGIMRWAFYNRLKVLYPIISVKNTYGYITKNTRIRNGLEKTHCVDARCISGHPKAEPSEDLYLQKAVRERNRCLHKATILKGGVRKKNQAPKYVFGHQLFDKVLYKGIECFVFGRRTSGSFDIRKLNGEKINAGISYKKLRQIEKRKTILIERSRRFLPMAKARGIRA